MELKSIAVFCGSGSGKDPVYQEKAYALVRTLAERNIRLVYGGSNIGLMKSVADGALEKGGKVVGVLPRFLQRRELAHSCLTELIYVDTMHERKYRMNFLSDGVIALPGGYGTLEEFFEMLTWAQLGLHKKPVAILNIGGFYDPLLQMVRKMVEEGFLKEVNEKMLLVSDDMDQLLEMMETYQPPEGKWISTDPNATLTSPREHNTNFPPAEE
ncbi:MAG: TIGR00730 family Rossman fold protein [Tannerellaceae bacterium]|nr:TIGR00730 family Rossman fold protein [Tannerellaceae bacterium]